MNTHQPVDNGEMFKIRSMHAQLFFNLKLNNWIKVIQFTSCQLSGSKSTETGDFCFVQHFQHSYSFFWHGRESAFFETKNRILIDRTNPDVTSTFFKLLQIFLQPRIKFLGCNRLWNRKKSFFQVLETRDLELKLSNEKLKMVAWCLKSCAC